MAILAESYRGGPLSRYRAEPRRKSSPRALRFADLDVAPGIARGAVCHLQPWRRVADTFRVDDGARADLCKVVNALVVHADLRPGPKGDALPDQWLAVRLLALGGGGLRLRATLKEDGA